MPVSSCTLASLYLLVSAAGEAFQHFERMRGRLLVFWLLHSVDWEVAEGVHVVGIER